MKKYHDVLAAMAVVILASGSALAKGNGLPQVNMSGAFLLNVHAVDNCPTASYDGSNRSTIVVQGLTAADFAAAVTAHGNHLPDLSDKNDIWLTSNDSADSFVVEDGNACDADGALFSMPELVATTYDVFIRLVGKPGTQANPVLCANDIYTDAVTGDYYCNTGTVRTRTSGQSVFVNVNDELLTILSADFSTYVFKDPNGSYFWDWSATTGAKAQVRFVPKPS